MRLFLSILLSALFTISLGQRNQGKELIKQVDNLISGNLKNYAPGCALLVAKKGEVLLEKGYGIANLELNVPMKPEMVFRIGSITKHFSAIAILQLVD